MEVTSVQASAEEAAAFWFARMRSDSLTRADRRNFLRWLNEDPAHSAAYADYEALWESIGSAAAEQETVEMRREALALAPERRSFPWRGGAAVAASLALLLVSGAALLKIDPPVGALQPQATVAQASADRVLRTAVGQRSAVTLDDGSVVELNTDSVVVVDYSKRRREVRLERGQALFEVVHDASRPFVVQAAGQRIVALGTAFDVRVDDKGMRVTLIEGRVAVEPAAGAAEASAARTLSAGEQLIARIDQPVVVMPADVQQAVGWRTGRLTFSDEPLAEVVEEINRYSTRKVVLADPSLGELRVSGVFRTGSVASFVTAMDAAFPVAAENREAEVVLSWD